jgi:hypothetical protein
MMEQLLCQWLRSASLSLSLSVPLSRFRRNLRDLNLPRFFDWAPFPGGSYVPCRRRDSCPYGGRQRVGGTGALAAGRRGDNYIMASQCWWGAFTGLIICVFVCTGKDVPNKCQSMAVL